MVSAKRAGSRRALEGRPCTTAGKADAMDAGRVTTAHTALPVRRGPGIGMKVSFVLNRRIPRGYSPSSSR
jgi:hypothetical protein